MQNVLAIVTLFSFVIQRVIEVFDEPLDRVTLWWLGAAEEDPKFARRKKTLATLVAIALGVLAAWLGDLELLKSVGYGRGGWADHLISGFALGSGTDGVNSFLKYVNYAKARQEVAFRKDAAEALQSESFRRLSSEKDRGP